MVATVARNSTSGETGGVLLTPAGSLPAPSAPANLQGVSHPATRMEPYNAINLSWENTSSLTRGYELERRQVGSATLDAARPHPARHPTSHTDTTVGVGITYEYRVRATGLGGASAWSNSVTVTSPATPLDTTPPVVSILTPANGATLSGVVSVSAQASDNVAVEYLEISYWNQYLGQEVILGSVSNAGTLTVSWDTRSLTPATYTVWAYAYDTLGNWTQTEISVNVTPSTSNVMRVTSIALSATGRSSITASGRVTVRTSSGSAVSGATVAITWRLPNGSSLAQSALTNSSGVASFSVRSGRGTYTLTVTGVTKNGYTFDAANSVLTKSITR